MWIGIRYGKYSLLSLGSCVPPCSHSHAHKHINFMFMVPCIADKIYLVVVQRDATQSSPFIILQVQPTCFGCQPHPSSGVHETVTLQPPVLVIFLCNYLPPPWPSLATVEGGSCTVPETVVTVLCTPDDGCGWHPKHVECTCRIINRLLCVASRWAIIK